MAFARKGGVVGGKVFDTRSCKVWYCNNIFGFLPVFMLQHETSQVCRPKSLTAEKLL